MQSACEWELGTCARQTQTRTNSYSISKGLGQCALGIPQSQPFEESIDSLWHRQVMIERTLLSGQTLDPSVLAIVLQVCAQPSVPSGCHVSKRGRGFIVKGKDSGCRRRAVGRRREGQNCRRALRELLYCGPLCRWSQCRAHGHH